MVLGGLVQEISLASPMCNMIYMLIVIFTPLYNSPDALARIVAISHLFS